MFVSLTLVCDYISGFIPTFIGNIGLKYIPLFLINYLTSFTHGFLTSLFSSLMSLLFIPHSLIINPWQYILDYFFPMLTPVIFSFLKINFQDRILSLIKIFLAITTFCIFIYIFHVISGVLFFNTYIWEGFNVWTYSLTYNIFYIGFLVFPILLIILPLLCRMLSYYREVLKTKLELGG